MFLSLSAARRCLRSLRVSRPAALCAAPLGRVHIHTDAVRHENGSRVPQAHSGPFAPRTHHCGGLTARDVDSAVVLAGWILRQRKVSNSLSFFALQDSYGSTQLALDRRTATNSTVLDDLAKVPVESVVLVEGRVQLRPKQAQRKNSPTGEVEVVVEKFTLLNSADHSQMPFLPSEKQNTVNEELRARFRHLDLRRSILSENLRKRSQVAHITRNVLHQHGFVEVETPVLLKSTPEGAREFLVPTRIRDSSQPMFYALPQSPQQPKQLLMCSGSIDKYYQIAKCFRDEDGRKDRQPEFTQVDLEMAFVSWGNPDAVDPVQSSSKSSNQWRIGGHEVRSTVELLMQAIWKDVKKSTLRLDFPVMTYYDAMTRYGSDKPDTRFGLELADVRSFLPETIQEMLCTARKAAECLILRQVQDAPFLEGLKEATQSDVDSVDRILLTESNLMTWLRQVRCMSDSVSENILASVSQDEVRLLNEGLRVEAGDVICLASRPAVPEGGSTHLGRFRSRLAGLAEIKGLYVPTSDPQFLWVTEFPLFTRADDDKEFLAKGRWSSSHHPFTAPMWQDLPNFYAGDVDKVRGQHYDLVLNGLEIAGGSVRVHDASMQDYIFTQILKLTECEISSFDHLLHALKCGAPPHGGIAIGLDRLMAVLCGTQTIRDVIAFPKSGAGTDTLFKSPSVVNNDVLIQYNITSVGEQ